MRCTVLGSKAGAESNKGHRQGVYKMHAQQFCACSIISRAAVSIKQDLVPSIEPPWPMASVDGSQQPWRQLGKLHSIVRD
ncbi:hypothetical protein RRG08_012769 [Elysia crispata]|uniref:Uncharacterized protein n=1 Tax=Elysia crispata TaxID=231223 RepID=A0AAE0YSS1_9GAST|nr:hypothetical protein RRG08_012769 [Elysia crispata]